MERKSLNSNLRNCIDVLFLLAPVKHTGPSRILPSLPKRSLALIKYFNIARDDKIIPQLFIVELAVADLHVQTSREHFAITCVALVKTAVHLSLLHI